MSKPYRAIVASYQTDEETLYKIMTVSTQVTWEWAKPEAIENDEELTQKYVPSLEYRDAGCQTTQVLETIKDINVNFPVQSYRSFLPTFDELFDPSYLEAPNVPSVIHKIDLNEKTAIVSYQNSTSLKSIDLFFLMSIDPTGVAKYLTTPH